MNKLYLSCVDVKIRPQNARDGLKCYHLTEELFQCHSSGLDKPRVLVICYDSAVGKRQILVLQRSGVLEVRQLGVTVPVVDTKDHWLIIYML